MPRRPRPLALDRTHVVGVIHSAASLRLAAQLAPGAVDVLEIRLDTLTDALDELRATLTSLRSPLLFTARHPREGGQSGMSAGTRRGLLEEFLPRASAVDLELRSFGEMAGLVAQIRQLGVPLILSHHDFRQTPSMKRLSVLTARARRAGADVFKIAATANHPADLARLLTLFPAVKSPRLSAMAMGEFGRVSRLLLAQAGSVLNYGYLDRASVPGQWPAVLLKQRLGELA